MSFGNGLYDKLNSLNINEDDEVDDSLVIGIDFGTTNSGVGWATRRDFENKQVNFITSWPGNGREEGKVPTEIWYDDDDEPAWGYEIPPEGDPFCWFKLLLLRTEDLAPELRQSEFVLRAQKMLDQSGRTAVNLIADYFRLLWEHVIPTIERAIGETVVEAFAFHVVITVPAIWKGYARLAMEDAVKKSGILDPRAAGDTKLTFAIEPEVAALSTLLEQSSGVRAGDVYVVCDAGGGTVDLISYEVKSTKPIVLQEAVEGAGGLCGGIFVDQTFEHMCKGRLGPKWKRLSNIGLRDIMKVEWEYGIKPRFQSPEQKKKYILRLPAETFGGNSTLNLDDTSREPHIKDGRIHFLGHHIAKAFDGVFAEIEELIQGQIDKAAENDLSVTGIILVGGLGGSPYLYECLEAIHSQVGIRVLQLGGMKPRTAICRGAVYKGFLQEEDAQGEMGKPCAPIMISSRVSRASYGMCFYTDFDASKHLEKDKRWKIIENKWVAENQMEWYLKRGEMISKVKPVRSSWLNLYEQGQFDGTLRITLYQCEDMIPPSRYISSVQRLGTVSCQLDIGYSKLADFKNKGKLVVKKLSFEIEMVPSGASVDFVVYVDGRKQGSERVEVRFE